MQNDECRMMNAGRAFARKPVRHSSFIIHHSSFVALLVACIFLCAPGARSAIAQPAPPMPPDPIAEAQLWNVSWFRQLLTMPVEAREQSLATLPPERRAFFERKLAQYAALPAAEREVQLRATELRSHLFPLMRAATGQRGPLLRKVPAELRALIDERLSRWDALPADVRDSLLEHQFAVDYFAQVDGAMAGYSEEDLRNVSGWFRTRLEEGLSRWRALPPDERRHITRQSVEFFSLDEREKDIVLGKLPMSEQQPLRATIAEIERLPVEIRAQCLDALREFASMSPEERQRFLLAVARWQGMSEAEKVRWRETSRQLPPLPPLPPGLALPDIAAR